MRSTQFLLFIAAIIAETKAIVLPRINTASFSNPNFTSSAGGNACCVTGTINVTVSATNEKILYSGPPNNMAATELLVEIAQQNSTIGATINGGPTVVSGTYGIFSKLCIPVKAADASKVQTVQLLTHGGTLDNTYWDFAPGYSYVDAAAMAGYATFSYDRLGTGLSDHPDSIQVVQVGIQVEVVHVLVQGLRAAKFGGWSFQNVVGVGHSLGTGLTQGVTTKYPKDFDAVILTGTSTYFGSVSVGVASTAQQIANTDPSGRFAGLANGYFTPAPVPQAIQFAFYRYPHFVPSIFNTNLATYQTNALGETFTLASAYSPSIAFTGPVDVVDGQHDFFYCGGDCSYPTDQAALVKPVFFPAASAGSQSYLVPDAGHNINAHYAAPQAFAQMLGFLKTNSIT